MAARGAPAGFRSVRRGGSILVTGILTLGILAMANVLATRRHLRFDLTTENRYSLSAQSKQLLSTLTQPVTLMAFYPGDDPNQVALRRLLDQYRAASPRLRYRFVDPDQEPGLAAQWSVREPGVWVEVGTRREPSRAATEEGITNALLRALRNRPVRIGFVEGHGEHDGAGRDRAGLLLAARALRDVSYRVSRVNLLETGGVPDSLDILVVASPVAEPSPDERGLLDAFLRRGGRLMALLEPPPAAGLAALLSPWGVLVGDNRVIDPRSNARLVGMDQTAPLVARYEDTPITRNFGVAIFFPGARSVELPEAMPPGARGWTLFKSSGSSWAETDTSAAAPRQDAGVDRLGPIPLAVAVIHRPEENGARLVVFGDGDFITNRRWQLPGSGDLFLNAMAWLAERSEEIAVRAPSVPERRVALTARQARSILVLGVFALPLAVVAAGVWTAWRRRGR